MMDPSSSPDHWHHSHPQQHPSSSSRSTPSARRVRFESPSLGSVLPFHPERQQQAGAQEEGEAYGWRNAIEEPLFLPQSSSPGFEHAVPVQVGERRGGVLLVGDAKRRRLGESQNEIPIQQEQRLERDYRALDADDTAVNDGWRGQEGEGEVGNGDALYHDDDGNSVGEEGRSSWSAPHVPIQTEAEEQRARNEGPEIGDPNWDQHVILSIHSPAGYKVAAAQWSPEDRVLYVLEDTKDTAGWDMVALLLEQVQPKVVIMSAQVQSILYEKVKSHCDAFGATVSLQLRSTFSVVDATHALSEARLPDNSAPIVSSSDESEEGAISREEEDELGAGMGRTRLSMVKLRCWTNVDVPAAVSAAGGLLVYMQKQKTLAARYDGELGIKLNGIQSLALEEHMVINQDALTSLAIFEVESHAYSNTGRNKQALSIYGLLNTCVTTGGKRLLHTWHLRPLLSLEAISDRHDAVALFSSPENHHTALLIRNNMKKVGNVGRVLTLLRKGDGKVKDWKTLADALTGFMMVRDQIMGVVGRQLPIMQKVTRDIDVNMYRLSQAIINTIDWDMSRDNKRVCIRRGISQELDARREQLAEMESYLDVISQSIAERVHRDFYDSLTVKYLPQLGFLTAISPVIPRCAVPHGWETVVGTDNPFSKPTRLVKLICQFATDESQFYKNDQMRNMDEHFGDMESEIADMEVEIVQDLVEQLRDVDTAVITANDVIAELDCLIALAEAAVTYDLVRPTMKEEPVLSIKNGRHILHELKSSPYIPNDTLMSGGYGGRFASMMLVTGANGSGKSAYGKQVALIAFMAQIGSFVPAEQAEIGLVDRSNIHEIADQGIGVKAFMIDLSQISLALRGMTSRSLLILDEFGKGTTTADGAGLLAGLIEHLTRDTCPRTIVLTHFHELLARNILSQDLPLMFCHMQSVVLEGAKELAYLYKLQPGQSLTSNAIECAAMHNIPPDILDRARFVTECITNKTISKLWEQELEDEDIQEINDAHQLARQFLQWEIDDKTDVRDRLGEILDAMDEDDEDDEEKDEETVSDELGGRYSKIEQSHHGEEEGKFVEEDNGYDGDERGDGSVY